MPVALRKARKASPRGLPQCDEAREPSGGWIVVPFARSQEYRAVGIRMRHDKIMPGRQGLPPKVAMPSLKKDSAENSFACNGEGAAEAKVVPFTQQHFCYCGRAPRKAQ